MAQIPQFLKLGLVPFFPSLLHVLLFVFLLLNFSDSVLSATSFQQTSSPHAISGAVGLRWLFWAHYSLPWAERSKTTAQNLGFSSSEAARPPGPQPTSFRVGIPTFRRNMSQRRGSRLRWETSCVNRWRGCPEGASLWVGRNEALQVASGVDLVSREGKETQESTCFKIWAAGLTRPCR